MRRLSHSLASPLNLGSALFLTLLGCSAGPPVVGADLEQDRDESEAALRPLWTVEIDADRRVEFFELSPGVVVHVAQTRGDAAQAQVEFDLRGSPTDVYRRLHPGETIPAALIDAEVRQRALYESKFGFDSASIGELVPSTPVTVSSPEAAQYIVPKHSSDAWFQSWACTPTLLQQAASGRVPACLLNRTGGGTTTTNRLWESAHAAYPYRGAIRMKLRAKNSCESSWVTFPDIDIAEGTSRTQWVWNYPWISIDVVNEISNASNDGYHRAVVVADTQTCRSQCYYDGSRCVCPVPWSPPPGYGCTGGGGGGSCSPGCSWDGSVCKCGI